MDLGNDHQKIYLLFLQQRDKFIYFLITGAALSIGFAATQTSNLKAEQINADFITAIEYWVCSIGLGLFAIWCSTAAMAGYARFAGERKNGKTATVWEFGYVLNRFLVTVLLTVQVNLVLFGGIDYLKWHFGRLFPPVVAALKSSAH